MLEYKYFITQQSIDLLSTKNTPSDEAQTEFEFHFAIIDIGIFYVVLRLQIKSRKLV